MFKPNPEIPGEAGSATRPAGDAVAVLNGSAPVLEIKHLTKTFPGVRALTDASLTIEAAEIHALVGQNGSGKSTLIKVLAGFYQPDEGTSALVNGIPLALGNSKAAHDLGIRFVHQDLGLIDNLSAVDNLALGFGYARGFGGRIDWKAQRERATRALKHVVDDFPLDKVVGSLTVFERTALAIARALQDFGESGSILVLDEPTATMPRNQVEHLFRLLHRVRDRGTSVLLVTHHLEEVFAVSDRVTVLRDGRIITTERKADLDTNRIVSLMTGGGHRLLERSTPPNLDEVVLSMRDVSGGALRSLDLDVHRGEIVGVAGLSGSGREELCGLIFGSARRGGEILIEGSPLRPNRPDDAVRSRLGLVPANRHREGLVMTESVRRNMTLATLSDFVRRGRILRGAEKKDVQTAVAHFGIKTSSIETPVGALSGGNQQKVVIAKWLRMNPRVLLLDEPTQGVDVSAQADLHQLLLQAASAGTSILVCSSDELELSRICDRVIVLHKGVVSAELSQHESTPERIFESTLYVEPAILPSIQTPDNLRVQNVYNH